MANGGDHIIGALASRGVDTFFTNPGTSELHLVDSLTRSGARSILTLFEGVAAGAADGFARMARRPAATLLHLGPGQGNALANLHNARRAQVPLINIIGDHAIGHRLLDPPLASDIEAVAETFSAWVQTVKTPEEAGRIAAEAVNASGTYPGRIATLIVPADIAWEEAGKPILYLGEGEGEGEGGPGAAAVDLNVDPDLDRLVASLRDAAAPALIVGGDALDSDALSNAARIGNALNAPIYCETFFTRMARGQGRFAPRRIPYFPEKAAAELERFDLLLLVGVQAPVGFFAYPDGPGELWPEHAACLSLVGSGQSCARSLADLADHFPRNEAGSGRNGILQKASASGRIDAKALGQLLAANLPEGAIVCDEAATSGGPAYSMCAAAPPHDWLTLTGGAIGQGLPVATGAAVACPGRKVIALQADGSALYTIQALWTQARENLDVLTLLLNNRSYAILEVEFGRLFKNVSEEAKGQFSLDRPEIDFVSLARDFGVEADRVETVEALQERLKSALRERGPRLIEVMLS